MSKRKRSPVTTPNIGTTTNTRTPLSLKKQKRYTEWKSFGKLLMLRFRILQKKKMGDTINKQLKKALIDVEKQINERLQNIDKVNVADVSTGCNLVSACACLNFVHTCFVCASSGVRSLSGQIQWMSLACITWCNTAASANYGNSGNQDQRVNIAKLGVQR